MSRSQRSGKLEAPAALGKRPISRSSDGEKGDDEPTMTEAPQKKKGTVSSAAVTELTSETKAAFKSIVQLLLKDERAEPFLYPVDKKMFPEYYQVIDRPMDLNTIKKNLNGSIYTTVQDVLTDLRLIWSNCMTFNSDGSDIALLAEELSQLTEDSIMSKLGADFALPKRGQSVASKIKEKKEYEKEKVVKEKPKDDVSKDDAATNHERKVFSKFIKDLKRTEGIEPFLFPVDLDFAPGYLEFVTTPMDVSTIEKQIKAGRYDGDWKLLAADVKLIFDNCIAYNQPGSDLHNLAVQLRKLSSDMAKKYFSEKKEDKIGEESVLLTVSKSQLPPVSRKPPIVPAPFNLVQSTIEREKAKIAVAKESAKAALIAQPPSAPTLVSERERDVSGNDEHTAKSGLQRGLYVLLGKTRKSDLNATGLLLHSFLKSIYKHEYAERFCRPVDNAVGKLDIPTMATRLLEYQDRPETFLEDIQHIMQGYMSMETNNELLRRAKVFSEYCDDKFGFLFPEIGVHIRERAPIVLKDPDETSAPVIHEPPVATRTIPLETELYAIDGEISTMLQSKSAAQIRGLIEDIQKCGDNNEYFKSKAILRAMENCTTQFPPTIPFLTADELFEVLSCGEVVTLPKFHTRDYLYPIEFMTKLALRLYVVPDGKLIDSAVNSRESLNAVAFNQCAPVELSSMQFVKFEVINHITTEIVGASLKETISGGPKFVVKSEGLGVLAQSTVSPMEVWTQLLGHPESILRFLGGPMRRCRAVFNRLCCHKGIVPFLEPVPPSNVHYHSVIKAPMWLREVHSRLVEGTYDNEYDFAWDVRLIFRNCMDYNAAGSDLHSAAQDLMNLFNVLLCHWVTNIQDRGVGEIAQGMWDQWYYLKYFDAPDNQADFCRATGLSLNASSLLLCGMCDDQYLPSALGLPDGWQPEGEWYCSRCVEAQEITPSLLAAVAPSSGSASTKFVKDIPLLPFSKDLTYIPSPDVGDGWCQCVRQNRQGLKHVYLSPLGYEIHSRADALEHKIFEDTVNENLTAARAKEYQDSLLTSARTKRTKSAKHHRKNSTTTTRITRRSAGTDGSAADENESGDQMIPAQNSDLLPSVDTTAAVPVALDEDEHGLILRGRLANFVIPAGYKVVLYLERCCDSSFLASDEISFPTPGNRKPVVLGSSTSRGNLPGGGLFGLDHEDIRCYLETFELASKCAGYVFKEYYNAKTAVVKELLLELEKREAKELGNKKLMESLNAEYNYWRDIGDVAASVSGINVEASVSGSLEHKSGFSTLFPSDITSCDGDVLLSVWDFLDVAAASMGSITISLSELIKCISPPPASMPTLGEVIFDEVGYLLTTVLLTEMRGVAENSDRFEGDWQSLLAARPLNILTWPAVALTILHALPFVEHVQLDGIFQANTRGTRFYHDLGFLVAMRPHAINDNRVADLFMLVLRHPLLHFFTNNSSFERSVDVSSALQTVKERYLVTLFDETVDVDIELTRYPDVLHVLLDMKNLIASLPLLCKDNSVGRDMGRELVKWFDDRIAAYGIDFSQLPLDESSFVGFVDDNETSSTGARANCHSPSSVLSDIEQIGDNCPPDQYLQPYLFGMSTNGLFQRTVLSFDLSEPGSVESCIKQGLKNSKILSSRLTAFEKLEATVRALRRSDPETWERSDRISVLGTFVDIGLTTRTVTQFKRAFSARAESVLCPDQLKLAGPVPSLESIKVSHRSNVRCYFTGLELKQVSNHQPWVIVPDWLLKPPSPHSEAPENQDPLGLSVAPVAADSSVGAKVSENANTDNESKELGRTRGHKSTLTQSASAGNTRIKGREIALESAVLAMCAAREMSLKEKVELENRVDESVRQLSLMELQPLQAKSIQADTIRVHSRIPRSRCLGYDRFGRQYWLLGVQESAPLVPLGRTLSNLMTTADPAVLVKEPSGWWGFHCGRYLDTLINSFSNTIPCEKRLRINMAERLNFARRKLYSTTLRFKQSQHEWLNNIVRGEVAISNYKVPSGSEAPKALELLWTRCVEVRGHVHYSELHRIDEFTNGPADQSVRAQRDAQLRRQKRLRDHVINSIFDLHPSHGWMFPGPMAHIRALYSCTSATRLMADPTTYRQFQEIMRRSAYRQQQVSATNKVLNHNAEETVHVPVDHMDIEGENVEAEADEEPKAERNVSNRGLRPVEQLHIATCQVLRIHRTGRDAARFLNVSQSGISLCLTGAKSDAYGFKWRYYVGPRIDFDAIEHQQMSLREIQDLQYYRGRRLVIDGNAPQPSAGSGALGTSLNPSAMPMLNPLPPKTHHPHLVLAETPMNPKLLKLKAELVNLLTIIPERRMRWGREYDLDSPMECEVDGEVEGDDIDTEDDEPSVAKKGSHSTVAEPSDVADADVISGESDDTSGNNKNAARLERRSRRQGRRERANDVLIRAIRDASSPSELLSSVLAVEKAIPSSILVDWDPSRLPVQDNAVTLASVALRIFAIDRALKYEDCPGIEAVLVQMDKPYRPRLCFAPRCFSTVSCTRYLGHDGRCGQNHDGPTRFLELVDGIPPAFPAHGQGPSQQAYTPAQLAEIANRKRLREEAEAEERSRKMLVAGAAGGVFGSSPGLGAGMFDPDSIEHVVPYVPTPQEISTLIWV